MSRLPFPLLLLSLILILPGCGLLPQPSYSGPGRAWVATGDARIDPLLERFCPVFVKEPGLDAHDRLGKPAAGRDIQGNTRVYVDPAESAVYALRQDFQTARGSYTNLIYRIHFQEVPFPHLGMGRNVGLLTIVTLDSLERPLLVTTVHTCGCHLAIVPTSLLPEAARPTGWKTGPRKVDGETLPGLLLSPEPYAEGYRPVVFLRRDTHRVHDIQLFDVGEIPWRFDARPAEILPMDALRTLPAGEGRTVSFYYETGPRRGYVQESTKPFERLLMSWWAFDPYIGRDKELGDPRETGVLFYTSLAPWSREDSNLWHFARMLKFRGWRL